MDEGEAENWRAFWVVRTARAKDLGQEEAQQIDSTERKPEWLELRERT